MNWLESACITVSYCYKDLVFVESNAFLIHFAKSDPPEIQILINTECGSDLAAVLESLLLRKPQGLKLKLLKVSY